MWAGLLTACAAEPGVDPPLPVVGTVCTHLSITDVEVVPEIVREGAPAVIHVTIDGGPRDWGFEPMLDVTTSRGNGNERHLVVTATVWPESTTTYHFFAEGTACLDGVGAPAVDITVGVE